MDEEMWTLIKLSTFRSFMKSSMSRNMVESCSIDRQKDMA